MPYTLSDLRDKSAWASSGCMYSPELDVSRELFRELFRNEIILPRKRFEDVLTPEDSYNTLLQKMDTKFSSCFKGRFDIKLPFYYFMTYATTTDIFKSNLNNSIKDILLTLKFECLSYMDIKTFTTDYPNSLLECVADKPTMKTSPAYSLAKCLQGLFEYPAIDEQLDRQKLAYSLYYYGKNMKYKISQPIHVLYLTDADVDNLRNTDEVKFIAFQQIQYRLFRDYNYFMRVYPLIDPDIISLMDISLSTDLLTHGEKHIDVLKRHFPNQDIDRKISLNKRDTLIYKIIDMLEHISSLDKLDDLPLLESIKAQLE